MKRHGDLFERIVHPDNLMLAYKKARKGKGWRQSVLKFESNLNGNLLKLQRMICTGRFKTSTYKEKVIFEPKMRTIYKLPFFPDRIVQHAILQILIPIWDGIMISDSYACRPGKGMHEASSKAMAHVRKYKYCLKGDVSKFYPSIDHDVLMRIILKKIKCDRTLTLLEDIVRSYPGGKNTPIGNYTSQWFGNLYLNELDTLVKQKFKVKPYLRYCDDFLIFSNSKFKLLILKKHLSEYLNDKLKLKLSKSSVFPVKQGVDFLGYRHFQNKILLRKSTAKRVMIRIKSLPKLLLDCRITIDQYRSSIASTEGWLKWGNTNNLSVFLKLNELKEVLL